MTYTYVHVYVHARLVNIERMDFHFQSQTTFWSSLK